jgi:TPR repeat protein
MPDTREFRDLVRRAEDGDPDAQYNVAELYRCGAAGVLRSYVEAEKWYVPIAEQGHRGAQLGLGLLYLESLNKRAEGIRLLMLAGTQGEAAACYELGRAFAQPGGLGSDPVAAYIWFCLAEVYGYRGACRKEIQKLESGLSIEQLLGAQLRAREEFRPFDVLAAAEEKELRLAEQEREACTAEIARLSPPAAPASVLASSKKAEDEINRLFGSRKGSIVPAVLDLRWIAEGIGRARAGVSGLFAGAESGGNRTEE